MIEKNIEDNDINMHGINNNSSSSSSSRMEDEAFLHTKPLLKQNRNNQEIQNDENHRYYTIISQGIPEDYRGDVFSSENRISEEVTQVLTILKDEV
jgi:hypothetical protein